MSQVMFNFKELCFICEKNLDRKHRNVVTMSSGANTKENLIKHCKTKNTVTSLLIVDRIESISPSNDVKPAYHKLCYEKLRQGIYPPPATPDENYKAALQKVFDFIITNGKEEFTLEEFRDLMQEQFRDDKTLFTALKNKFGDEITIIQTDGESPKFLYSRMNIAQICLDWHHDRDSVSHAAREKIVSLAAEILKKEITNHKYNHPSYPESSTFPDDVRNDIPPRLSYFVNELLSKENDDSNDKKKCIKQNFIAHSIISTVHPKPFFSTLQLALGAWIHKKFNYKWMIQMLSKLGVCASFEEVQAYEASTTTDPEMLDIRNAFLQYTANKTDHDINSSDSEEEEASLESLPSTSADKKRLGTKSDDFQDKRKKY